MLRIYKPEGKKFIMQQLIKQEQFEIEVLYKLNSSKLLQNFVFTGGTMLRLCYGLNRFSVDLDFWMAKQVDLSVLFRRLKETLSVYQIVDAADKFNTLLVEIKDKRFPRALKIEIRKTSPKVTVEKSIAFSRFGNIQVFVNTVSPEDIMLSKINALIDRKEIRDAFDIEFLLKRGIALEANRAKLIKVEKTIRSFKHMDYQVKLGSLIEQTDRQYYSAENFKILLREIKAKLSKIQE
jgi:predicted nucleotidyltransferase component of viral defense system